MPICSVPPSNPTAKLPAITPTRISTNATEIPVRIEIKLPVRASPIQTAAINQIFSSIKKLLSFWKESLARAVFPALSWDGKLHCLRRTLLIVHFGVNSTLLGFLYFGWNDRDHILKRSPR